MAETGFESDPAAGNAAVNGTAADGVPDTTVAGHGSAVESRAQSGAVSPPPTAAPVPSDRESVASDRESVPPAAAALFGTALPRAERYAELLTGPAVERGLIGPDEADRIWPRHLLNCAAIAELVPHPATLVDLGSGAGLPGIVLAMLLPDVEVMLLEPMARRVRFLTECVATLSLDNAIVRRGRAEDMAGQIAADVVVARAVAPLDRLAPLAAGLARPGGLVLAMKGAGATDEIARAQPVLRRMGASGVELVRAGVGSVEPTVAVVRFSVGSVASRDRGPMPRGGRGRRSGIPGSAGGRSAAGAGARQSRMDRPGGRKGG